MDTKFENIESQIFQQKKTDVMTFDLKYLKALTRNFRRFLREDATPKEKCIKAYANIQLVPIIDSEVKPDVFT